MKVRGPLLAVPVGILTWFVVGSIPNMLGNYGFLAALFVLFIGPAAGFVVGGGVAAYFESLDAAEDQRKRDEKAQAIAALELQALAERQLRELKHLLRHLCLEAQSAALSLPTVLAAAEMALDRADEEFSDGLYSPFWEAMEEAAAQLHSFDQQLHVIASRKAQYFEKSTALDDPATSFSLGGVILPDPATTHNRLRLMYRRAQKDSDFASIYEQRRISSKVDRTNAILIAGFTSLGDAIQCLGDRIVDSMQDLRSTLDMRLGTLQASLENAASTAAEQRNVLLAEVRASRGVEESVLGQLRQDADRRSEHEREARKMLDNIQRRRNPVTGAHY